MFVSFYPLQATILAAGSLSIILLLRCGHARNTSCCPEFKPCSRPARSPH